MLILDSTALLDILLNTPNARRLRLCDPLLEEPAPAELVVPHVADLEIVEALHRYRASGEISAARADQALLDLHKLPIERREHVHLSARILELRNAGARQRHAVYLALAEHLGAPILTSDPQLRPVPGQQVEIRPAAERGG